MCDFCGESNFGITIIVVNGKEIIYCSNCRNQIMLKAYLKIQQCKKCGCSNHKLSNSCVINGIPCHWVKVNLCSSCLYR